MENLTNAVWIAAILGALVGGFAVYLLTRNRGSAQQNRELAEGLKAAQAKIDEQKQQLEQHFATSAELLNQFAADYKKLYTHLAASSEKLLPEESHKISRFNPELLTETATDDQPKDYSEGSSGLFKQV